MNRPVADIIADYQPDIPLERAETIPAAWYTDPQVAASLFKTPSTGR